MDIFNTYDYMPLYVMQRYLCAMELSAQGVKSPYLFIQ